MLHTYSDHQISKQTFIFLICMQLFQEKTAKFLSPLVIQIGGGKPPHLCFLLVGFDGDRSLVVL